MNKTQKEQLEKMLVTGIPKSEIARQLNVSVSTVTSYVRRHPVPSGYGICKQCGTFISPAPGRRIRTFCSDKCRFTWWNHHRGKGNQNTTIVTCQYCGKPFRAYESDGRKFCSRACYHASRRIAGSGQQSNPVPDHPINLAASLWRFQYPQIDL